MTAGAALTVPKSVTRGLSSEEPVAFVVQHSPCPPPNWRVHSAFRVTGTPKVCHSN